MSIYATLWRLRFPASGDDFHGCEWIEILAQAVPGHIGTPLPGYGYEDGDPYASFLPPPITDDPDTHHRAVVIVVAGAPKGTQRSPQEYADSLMTLTGEEYQHLPFWKLHEMICDLLRNESPRVVAQIFHGTSSTIIRDDGSTDATERG
jgi:hypothetical protein